MPELTIGEVKGAIDELGRVWKSFREENDSLLEKGKQTQKEWTEKLQNLNDRMDELDTKLNRRAVPTADTAAEESKAASERKSAFYDFLRYGFESLPAEQKALLVKATNAPGERKALSSAQGTEFLASPEITRDLIKGVVEFSPIRSICSVKTSSSKTVKVRKRTGTFSAVWVAKQGTRSETTGLTYGLEEVPNHEVYALVDIPHEDLEDSDFNLEAELSAECAEQFGVAEGTSSVTGDAVGEMEGFMTNADIANTVSGDANLITADGLIDLAYSLKDAYARNATWVFRRATTGKIRKLKGSDNNYLWQPGLGAGAPNMLLDRPYVECVDMPAVAANAYPVAFGDFRRGYQLVERLAMTMQRDPFTQQTSGVVRFLARKRIGGQVILAEAIKKLKIST